ncbi:MAG: hypothetical protein ACK4F9_06050, partial [Brevinematia bacterium]
MKIQKVFVKSFSKDSLNQVIDAIKANFGSLFEFENVKSNYEFARLKSNRGTLIFYKSGKVVFSHVGMEEVENFMISLGDNNYEVMIGVDETGKGELFGSIIVCAVRIEKNKDEIEKVISTFNTKVRANLRKYKMLFGKLKKLGVIYIVKKILPKDISTKRTNSLLSNVYSELVCNLVKDEDREKKIRIVLDDFGFSLDAKKEFEEKYDFAKVIIEHK